MARESTEMPALRRDTRELTRLIDALAALRAEMLALEDEGLARVKNLNPAYRPSARNLLHYLALRRHDLRDIQEQLLRLGLSSLGRCESYVLASLDAVLEALHRLADASSVLPPPHEPAVGFAEGPALLDRNAEALLGPPRVARRVRILVTLPSEAADDPALVERYLREGMDCARINCAHDDAATWTRMLSNLRRAEEVVGRGCKVLMDLAGPKLRTGPVEPAPAVKKLRPTRDPYGHVVEPLRVPIVEASPDPAARPAPETAVALPRELLSRMRAGDVLHLVDTRGARRRLRVAGTGAEACALVHRTTYVATGLAVELRRGNDVLGQGTVGPVACAPGKIRLQVGETLEVTRSLEPGRSAQFDGAAQMVAPARIGCTLPEVLGRVRVGEPILFDDGKVAGTIREVGSERFVVEITQTADRGASLGADKGINLPASDLGLPALTERDLEDLAFVVEHAHAVALSFVSRPADVDLLEEHLRRLGRPNVGIVLKIETQRAFECLPDLLLASMQSPCDGVMIARGDLAVECGWQRLAEVQEEILWLCEAAHIPVIWATQVLESLAKEGRPSRAEITDAAMGERAECVMLNKGPHMDLAVRALDDILRRMQDHQRKKRAMLRQLRVAGVRPR